ncbi:alpha/beta hydrolase [Stutzerimonas nitrititolerans]|uniref:alpha/beta hydrolase n=2 Tax=Stutzerimonas nitrititolerans TaxID=2482751 RepID=UPI0007186E28|nr:alpha/beta hydrolase-fold protein [Stutzerimonas nitrititolerans]KRW68398.1 alpha/beta hydrolase [Pseudomonas sp. TTU2014-066ASC]SUD85835.1 hydrolase of alpha/beta superfamily protein [Stutzerimonas stutzeri]
MKRLAMATIAALATPLAPAAAPHDWQPVTLPQAEQRILHSTHTGRDYRIFVSQPRHEPPPGGYPVLYVLDGNALFPSLATQAQALEARPDPTLRNSVLVVGVGYPGEALYDFKARAEDYTPDAEDRQRLPDREPPPYGGAERFLDFLESELKPMIAARHPVDPQRQTLFGHSYGGLFTLYALLNRPQAFSGYVAASPSIWWYQGYIERTLAAFEARARQQPLDARLLLTVGSAEEPAADAPLTVPRQRHMAERRMIGNARDLAERLESTPGLEVGLRINAGANHGSNGQLSSVQALELASSGLGSETKAKD